jgi:hypothetical protein
MLDVKGSTFQTEAVSNNSLLILDDDQPVVSQTVEYTEGALSSPYFISSSLCD